MSKIVLRTRGGPFSYRRRNFVPPGEKKGVQTNPPVESKPPAPDNGAVGPNLPSPGNGGVGIPEVPTTPITPPPGEMRILPIDIPPPGIPGIRPPPPPTPTPTPAPTPAPAPKQKSALDQYRERMQSRLKNYRPGQPIQQGPAQTTTPGLIGGAMTDYSKPYSM